MRDHRPCGRFRTTGYCDACFTANYPVLADDNGKTPPLHPFEAVSRR